MPLENEYIYLLVTVCFLVTSCQSMNSVNAGDSTVNAENVAFTQDSGQVNITYDLISTREDGSYEVHLLLYTNDDESYRVNETALSGDIGHGVLAGEQKTIIWDVLHDFPQGLSNDQIQFGINVMQDTNRSRKDWVYLTAGVVVLGAGLSAMILMDGNENSRSSGLPLPPSRPGF